MSCNLLGRPVVSSVKYVYFIRTENAYSEAESEPCRIAFFRTVWEKLQGKPDLGFIILVENVVVEGGS
jgi:hypothetical protein